MIAKIPGFLNKLIFLTIFFASFSGKVTPDSTSSSSFGLGRIFSKKFWPFFKDFKEL